MIRLLAILTVIICVANILTVVPGIPQAIYYGSFLLILLLLLLHTPTINLNLSISLVVIFSLISILLNYIPGYFHPEERFIAFLIILLLLGPLINNDYINEYRITTYNYFNLALLGIVFISLIGRFSGIFPGIGRAGLYQGITSHSMLMGPISAISIVYSYSKYTRIEKQSLQKWGIACLIVIAFISLILSASRGAIAGGGIGLIAYLAGKNKGNIFKLISNIAFVSIIGIIVIVFNPGITESVERKMDYGVAQEDVTATRSKLWNARIQEFSESPFFGIGFASARYGAIDTTTGVIEPGTSWGMIFAQIGLFGGVPFTFFVLTLLFRLYRYSWYNDKSPLLLAILSFYIVHWITEGYMLASGNFLFAHAWLGLSVMNHSIKKTEQDLSSDIAS